MCEIRSSDAAAGKKKKLWINRKAEGGGAVETRRRSRILRPRSRRKYRPTRQLFQPKKCCGKRPQPGEKGGDSRKEVAAGVSVCLGGCVLERARVNQRGAIEFVSPPRMLWPVPALNSSVDSVTSPSLDLLYYRVDTSRFVNNAVLARRVLRCRALPMLLRDLDVLRVEGGGGAKRCHGHGSRKETAHFSRASLLVFE